MNSIGMIEELLRRKTTAFHFVLKDLRNDSVLVLGKKKDFPICSCFKLAALMTLFDQLDNEKELDEIVTITPNQFSSGAGIISHFTSSIQMSLLQLTQLMMGFSDGTATDFIIEKISKGKLSSCLSRYAPQSKITRNQKEMIEDFLLRFSIQKLKNLEISDSYTFEDVTNAADLVSLAEAAYKFSPRKVAKSKYDEALRTKVAKPRTAVFFPPELSVVGKTGSLGFAFFANECGVIEFNGAPIASFGICTEGFKEDKDVVDLIFGQIGIYLLEHLSFKVKPNSRYSGNVRCVLD